ncbi:MAG TPA: MDR family MFS transporter [Mycobacteriales bacterium]|nr:MDR family MFS transporter [Mycobacteriales bacterium]
MTTTAVTAAPTRELDLSEVGSAAAGAISRSQMNMVFATVMVAMLLSALDQTIVSTALPTIVGDLGGGHLSWVVSAYLLADTISTVLTGRLSDRFGRKLVLQLSAGMFVVASAMCGFAHSMTWLIAWRGIQGLGAGGLGVTASAVIADVIPLKERSKYQGALGAVFGVALVLGPLLGGLFTDHLSWRWVFLVNLPIGIVLMALAAITIPKINVTKRAPIDYAGIMLVSIGAAAVTLALSWGGNSYAWGSSTIIGLVVGSAIAFALFVWVESRAAEPMLPLHLFSKPVFSFSVVLTFIVGFVMLGALTFMPTFSQYVQGISPTMSGVRGIPMVVALFATSMLAGTVVSKTGRYKLFPITGFLTMAVGLYLFSRLTPTTGYPTLCAYMIVFGAGVGLSMQILTTVVQSTVDFRDLGVATSGVGFFRTLGSSFGTAIFGTIFANALAPLLAKALVHSPGVNPSAVSSPETLHAYPSHEITPIVAAYSHALHLLFLAGVPVALVGFAVSLFLKQQPLRSTAQAGASDVGDGFNAPVGPDRMVQLEQAISRMLRSAGPDDIATIRSTADTSLDGATGWSVGVVTARSRMGLPTDLHSIAARFGVPAPVMRPAFDTARTQGFLSGDDGALAVTDRGREELEHLGTSIRDWLTERLADWNAEDDPAFDDALRHVARSLVA